MGKIDVVEAIRSALLFWRAHWRGALGPQLVVLLTSVLEKLWDKSAPIASQIVGLAGGVAAVMIWGALYRLALAPDHPGSREFRPGPAGFQWRGFEWSVVGFFICAGIVLLILGLMGVGIYAAATGWNFTSAFPPPSAPVIVAGVLLVAVAVYVIVRCSLAFPLTLESGEFRFGWKLTRGRVVPLFAAQFVLGLGLSGAGLLGDRVATFAGRMGGMAAASGLSPEAQVAVAASMSAAAAALVSAALGVFVTEPLQAGLTAALYRMLRGAPAAEPELQPAV